MKIRFHRLEQDDLGGETILACHMKSSYRNRSTRLFALTRYPATGIYTLTFGGRFVREFFVGEIDAARKAVG